MRTRMPGQEVRGGGGKEHAITGLVVRISQPHYHAAKDGMPPCSNAHTHTHTHMDHICGHTQPIPCPHAWA